MTQSQSTPVTVGKRLPYEILHIDGHRSGDFFVKVRANDFQKQHCLIIVQDLFAQCCAQYGGVVRSKMGDGAYAVFEATEYCGNAIKAAAYLIAQLPVLVEQTQKILGGVPLEVGRHFRIAAHYGLVTLALDSGSDTGEIDRFLKHERDVCTDVDCLFITDELWRQLDTTSKRLFAKRHPRPNCRRLGTTVHRMIGDSAAVAAPPEQARADVPPAGIAPVEIAHRPENLDEKDWNYLEARFEALTRAAQARNAVTAGVTAVVAAGRQVKAAELRELTLNAIYNYLRALHTTVSFRLVLWRADGNGLRVKSVYPPELALPRQTVPFQPGFRAGEVYKTCKADPIEDMEADRAAGKLIDIPELVNAAFGMRSAVAAAHLPHGERRR